VLGSAVAFTIVNAVVAAVVLMAFAGTAHAQEAQAAAETAQGVASPLFSAALAVGLGSVAAGIAVAIVGSAAIGGMAQRPEIFGRSLVIVGLAEGIAIYGLIVAFMILTG
jgi:V/A-type H+-transporting ATPase subunit K